MTIFEDVAFKKVIKVKWGHKGGTLIQYNSCLYKERERETDHVKIQQEGSHLQANGWGLRKKQPCWLLDFGLQNYEKITFSCISHPVYGTPSKPKYLQIFKWHKILIKVGLVIHQVFPVSAGQFVSQSYHLIFTPPIKIVIIIPNL